MTSKKTPPTIVQKGASVKTPHPIAETGQGVKPPPKTPGK